MNDMYQTNIMEHYRFPKNKGIINNAHFSSGVINPSCGDAISFTGLIDNNILVAVKFEGTGCVISQAAASMLSDYALNKSYETINAISRDDMVNLVGITLGPTRLRCALISLEALQKGLHNYAQLHQVDERI